MVRATSGTETTPNATRIHLVKNPLDYPAWTDSEKLVDFLHESLAPYQDKKADIAAALKTCLAGPIPGGFILLAETPALRPAGALVMLKTGMSGYIPPNLLLFVAVASQARGAGLGRRMIEQAIAACDGDLKLHVEYENPAKRLYERVGFRSNYAEMRFHK